MKNFLIGLLIGIGKIIPGVSGSLIAIRLNVYEKMIDAIIHYFKNIKRNTLFLTSIFSGVIIAIFLMSNLLMYFITNYRFPTLLVFVLLIASGIKEIYQKGDNLYIAIITFSLSLLLIKLPINNLDISYFTMGIIESISMIIPGISGTAIYISFGAYEKMLNLFIAPKVFPVLLFALGFLVCSLIIIKLIDYCFKKYKKETYSAILGFLLASIILMFN